MPAMCHLAKTARFRLLLIIAGTTCHGLCILAPFIHMVCPTAALPSRSWSPQGCWQSPPLPRQALGSSHMGKERKQLLGTERRKAQRSRYATDAGHYRGEMAKKLSMTAGLRLAMSVMGGRGTSHNSPGPAPVKSYSSSASLPPGLAAFWLSGSHARA